MTQRITLSVQKAGPLRSEQLFGREFRVFPAVLVREQVLNNNLGATFLPASEIQDSVASWNMIPVVVRHPTRRGTPITARDPAIINARGVGFLFRARFADNALKADVFLDPESVDRVEGARDAVASVQNGQPTELSTGFGTTLERMSGAHNGRAYDVVMRDIRPDHLALLPDEVGACSVADGCGFGVNHEGTCEDTEDGMDEETQGRFAQALDRLVAFLSRAETPNPETIASPDEPVEPVANTSQEGDNMRERLIAQLSEAGPLNRDTLNSLSDCELAALAGAHNNTAEEPQGSGWDQAREWRQKYETLDAQTQNARETEERERSRMVDDILYAGNRAYSDDEVLAMDFASVKKLHLTMFPPSANYTGRGGPRASNAGGDFSWVKPVLGHRDSVLNQEAN